MSPDLSVFWFMADPRMFVEFLILVVLLSFFAGWCTCMILVRMGMFRGRPTIAGIERGACGNLADDLNAIDRLERIRPDRLKAYGAILKDIECPSERGDDHD